MDWTDRLGLYANHLQLKDGTKTNYMFYIQNTDRVQHIIVSNKILQVCPPLSTCSV